MEERLFDSVCMVDWSAAEGFDEKPRPNAIWACTARENGGEGEWKYLCNRRKAEKYLEKIIKGELAAERKLVMGFDFTFGYPKGFAEKLTGENDPFAVWQWLAENIKDNEGGINNRFELAGKMNLKLMEQNDTGGKQGPFWFNAKKDDIEGLPRKKSNGVDYCNPFGKRRAVEGRANGSFTVWQLGGVGAVGSQTLTGLPVLHRLREKFRDDVAVWPFDSYEDVLRKRVVFIEIWPTVFTRGKKKPDELIKDAWQVKEMTRELMAMERAEMERLLKLEATKDVLEEGWIFGIKPPASSGASPPRLIRSSLIFAALFLNNSFL